jgi:hypothetical protein
MDHDTAAKLARQERRREKVWYYYHVVLFNNGQVMRDQKHAIINYKGITMDLRHRLLQHNAITVGGARSTTKYIMKNGKRY